MDEKRLRDGLPLGFIEKNTFGRAYMRAVAEQVRRVLTSPDWNGKWEKGG